MFGRCDLAAARLPGLPHLKVAVYVLYFLHTVVGDMGGSVARVHYTFCQILIRLR